ncbi:hypothetical protein BKA82DRAFT_138803, partial [Pisolithus tinctorius]
MDIPELVHNGCNWNHYGEWVLQAVDKEGLMRLLNGSETQPTDPIQLEGSADSAWQQCNDIALHLIICGLPDSILCSIMHLESAHKMFIYLESCY